MRKVLLGLVFVLAACNSHPEITEGYINRRDFIPAHEEAYWDSEPYQDCGYKYGYNYSSGEYDHNYRCSTEYRQVRRYRWVRDQWYIQIHGCAKEEKKDKDYCADRRVQVDQGTYEKSKGYSYYDIKKGELKRR